MGTGKKGRKTALLRHIFLYLDERGKKERVVRGPLEVVREGNFTCITSTTTRGRSTQKVLNDSFSVRGVSGGRTVDPMHAKRFLGKRGACLRIAGKTSNKSSLQTSFSGEGGESRSLGLTDPRGLERRKVTDLCWKQRKKKESIQKLVPIGLQFHVPVEKGNCSLCSASPSAALGQHGGGGV